MDKTPLKIGITCYPTFGGSGVIATEIGMALARRGHRIHFICHDVPRRLQMFTENIFFHEVVVHDYPLFNYPPYSLSLASKMVEVASYEKLDIFHLHYAVPHATSAYLAKQMIGAGAPKSITTLHGTDITLVGNDRSYLPITRFSISESDSVTAPSQYLKNATYDKLNLSTSVPIEVIPNFVNTEIFCPPKDPIDAAASILGVCPKKNGTKIISHVSNFRPVKRVSDVVATFAEINRHMPAHLVLVGDGPDRSKVENYARELGLGERVCFLGKQESFVTVLQHSDLFLLPSESESFGLAALEAMSCGAPVIASNVQGIPEVVVHGETGFLSDPGDTGEMAKNALSLLSNPDLHRRFSEAARRRVLDRFQLDPIIDMYEDLYYRVR